MKIGVVKNLFISGILMMICFVAWPLQAKAESNPANFKYVINEDGESVTVTGYEGDETGDLVIPDTLCGLPVTIIGDEAFADMRNFKGSLTIPDSVKVIGNKAFYWGNFTGGLTIPNSVITIGNEAFNNSRFSGDLIIPDSVMTIGDAAFFYCVFFNGTLTIGNGVKTIGAGAFSYCTKFTGDLVIPNSVMTIGQNAFYNCEGFSSISVPFLDENSMGGKDTFLGNCTDNIIYLKGYTIFFEKNNDEVTGEMESFKVENKLSLPLCEFSAPDNLIFFGWSYSSDGEKITEEEIAINADTKLYALWIQKELCTISFVREDGTTFCDAIEEYYGNTIVLPTKNGYRVTWNDGSKTYEGGEKFCVPVKEAITLMDVQEELYLSYSVDVNGMATITGYLGEKKGNLIIPDEIDGHLVTTIGQDAFSGCEGFTGELTIPNSVTTIGQGAFYSCKGFTGLKIGNSVTTIGQDAFIWCEGFTGELTIPNSVMTIEEGAFYSCKGFTGELTIPNSVTTIGRSAFSWCEGFTGELTIPNSVTTIEEGAFYSCKGFTGLKIGNSVTTIGQNAFSWCEGFTSLTIGNSVTTIGQDAFSGCEGFTGDLLIPASVTSIGSYVFYNTSFNSISVPFPNKDCMINDPNWNNDVFYGCNAEIIYCGEYVVSFDPNKDNITGSMENKKTENKKIKLPECGFISKGYKFVGWSYEADGEKIEESEIAFANTTKNITLYALWEKLPVYKITFAGGSGATGKAPSALSGNEKDKVTLPKNTFTKKGYKFVCWTDGIKTYNTGDEYTIPAKNVELTAKWEKLPVYKITFAGGSGATGTAPAALFGNEKDKVTLPKNTFTKKGYKFVGWTDGSKTYKAGASYTITAKNVKLTAKWQKNEPTKRELIEQFAERMYTKALGRSAEPDGLKYWADRLEKQIDDGANMAYGFITSDEFKARKLSDDQFIETMYQTFFGRTADSTGKTYWMNQIKSGASRETVLAGFVKSEEFGKLCSDAGIERGLILEDGTPVNAGIYQFVKRQYTCCLQRDGERDGMDYWATKIAKREVSAVDAAKEFFFSAEFESKGLSDKQFVERLYETFLGRPFDEIGYAYWNDKMSKGETRREVIDEFAASEEFKGILKSFNL